MPKTADINYYTVRDKAIELGIIKVCEKDGSHSFNASPEKLYALVLSFANKPVAGVGDIIF